MRVICHRCDICDFLNVTMFLLSKNMLHLCSIGKINSFIKNIQMKKLILSLLFLHILTFGAAQDWKKISTPRKSYLNILYQNQKGQILAETKPRIGFVSSVDDGISWQFIDKIDIYFYPKIFTEDKNGDIFLFWRNTILKYNFIST